MDYRLEMLVDCLELTDAEIEQLLGCAPGEELDADGAQRLEACYRAVRVVLREVDPRWLPTVTRLPSPTLSGRTLLESLAQDPASTAIMVQTGFAYDL